MHGSAQFIQVTGNWKEKWHTTFFSVYPQKKGTPDGREKNLNKTKITCVFHRMHTNPTHIRILHIEW